jgi:GNAT superfamily N-acetyltransferase
MSQNAVNFAVRRAALADLDVIVRHRRRMFEDMGHTNTNLLDLADGRAREWLRLRLENDTYLGWFAVVEDRIVSGVGLWLMDWIPGPRNVAGLKAYVLNVYTEPEFRRKGIAKQLMLALLDWCRAHGYPGAVLHASDDGRSLYELLGFKPTNEMGTLFSS